MNDPLLMNARVLVAEDNFVNQYVLKQALKQLSVSPTIVTDGKQVIEQLKTQEFDVILMDIHMPKMDGIEATQHIRQQLESRIPIIAITAMSIHDDLEKCMEAGMNGYIIKPYTIESLAHAMLDVLNKNGN